MNLINDIVEAGAAVESLQHPMFMEYSNLFGVPVMGVSSWSTFSSATIPDRPRPLLFWNINFFYFFLISNGGR